MTRSFIISSSLITVNQWFEHRQNTAMWQCGESQDECFGGRGWLFSWSGRERGWQGEERSKACAPQPCEMGRDLVCRLFTRAPPGFWDEVASGGREMAPWVLQFVCCSLSCPNCAPGLPQGAGRGERCVCRVVTDWAALGQEWIFYKILVIGSVFNYSID